MMPRPSVKNLVLFLVASLVFIVVMFAAISVAFSETSLPTNQDPCSGRGIYNAIGDLRACLRTEIPLILTGQPE